MLEYIAFLERGPGLLQSIYRWYYDFDCVLPWLGIARWLVR